jgi:hypothetical protein
VFSGDILNNLKKLSMLLEFLVEQKKSYLGLNQNKLTWFEAKGKIEQLFKQLNLGFIGKWNP